MLKQSTVTAATQSAARLTSWDIHETSALYSTISCYNKHLLLTVFHLQRILERALSDLVSICFATNMQTSGN